MKASEDLKLRLFGGVEEIRNVSIGSSYSFIMETDSINIERSFIEATSETLTYHYGESDDIFSRIFIGKDEYQKINYPDSVKLSLSSSNLERVLKRLLLDTNKQADILEWLQLLIPGFDKVEIHSDSLAGTDTLLVYEKASKRPFHKRLISDGTYNILCLLTAVYQSDEPQFLCIEEPENGLTPDVIKELVKLFRNACEEKGHYIWLNTHSQSLVSQLAPDELIAVDKVHGQTRIKQFKGKDFHGLSMDEAWLTNTLGAGLPW